MARTDRILEMVDQIILRDEKLEAFLDASPWGILVVDKTFHIMYVNKRFSKMTGYAPSEVIGQHLHMLMPQQDRFRHIKHEKSFLKAPHEREGNHGLKPIVVCKDGSLLRVEISLGVSEVQGKTMFFASIRSLVSLFNTVEGEEKSA